MKGIIIQPGEAPSVCKLPNSLQGLQAILQGYASQICIPGDALAVLFAEAAGAKGLDKVFYAACRSEGGDGSGRKDTNCIYRTLHQQLTQIKAGLLQCSHGGIAAGTPHQHPVHHHILPADFQKGPLAFDVQKAQPT